MRSEPKTEIGLIEIPECSRTARAVELLEEARAASSACVGVLLELDAGVEVLGVLAHDDDVGLGEARADALVGLARADARVEVELLAQEHVDQRKPEPTGVVVGPLDPDAVALDRVQRAVGERGALLARRRPRRRGARPTRTRPRWPRARARGLDELGAGAVAGDEGHGVGHRRAMLATGGTRRDRSGSSCGGPLAQDAGSPDALRRVPADATLAPSSESCFTRS